MTTITFQCYSCNQVLKVGADKAGRKAKCVKCGTILTIPVASSAEERVSAAPAARTAPKPVVPPPVPAKRFGDEEDNDRPRGKRRPDDDDFEDEVDRPRGKRRRHDDDEDDDDRPRQRRSRNDEDDHDDDRPRQRKSRADDEDEDDDRPRRRKSRDEEDEDDDDRPRKRRSRDDDDEDDDDRGRRRRSGVDSWDKVKLGLKLVFIGLLVSAGGFAVERLGVLLYAFNVPTDVQQIADMLRGSRGMLIVSVWLIRLGLTVVLGGTITCIVGYVFWIFLKKNKYGALAFAIATLACFAVDVLLIGIFDLAPGFRNRIVVRSTEFYSLVNVAGWVLFALYLKGLARMFKDRALESRAALLIIISAVAGAVQLIGAVVVFFMASSGVVNTINIRDLGAAMDAALRAANRAMIAQRIVDWLVAILMAIQYIMYILSVRDARNMMD